MMMMVAPKFIRISIFCAFGAINGPIIYSGPLVLSRLVMKSVISVSSNSQFQIPKSRREEKRQEQKRREVK
jgi:hypothetical protein